jgi:serine/threonine-protein kinase
MAVDEVLDLGILLADALDRMHGAGLLHRDIKPSNIGYTADGVPKLLDFGLAAMLHPYGDELTAVASGAADSHAHAYGDRAGVTRTLTQQLVGTPLYLSPEALGGEHPDASFDLWSLSLVLYEAIAQRHPFAGYPVEEVMRRTRAVRIPDVRDFSPDCPPEVAAFLNDALALSKTRRPGSAAILRAQLQKIRPGFAGALATSRRPLY